MFSVSSTEVFWRVLSPKRTLLGVCLLLGKYGTSRMYSKNTAQKSLGLNDVNSLVICLKIQIVSWGQGVWTRERLSKLNPHLTKYCFNQKKIKQILLR